MVQPRLCLQTQTPLLRLLRPVEDGTRLEGLREEKDYLISPGGVTRMLRGLASRLESRGRIAPASWISLAREDARLRWGRGQIDFVTLPEGALERYAAAKSALWDELHSGKPSAPAGAIREGLALLAKSIGERARQMHEATPFDVFYTHDFQLLEVARHLPERVPRIFQWHVPVRPISQDTCRYVAQALNAYDAIVVSTHGYAEELRSWGVRSPIHYSYPYLDESRRRVVTAADVASFDERHGLDAEDIAFVLVARMDPIKSHDVAIRALARIRHQAPRAKLVLVGGGGFSGGRQGLGLSTAEDWRATLEKLASDLGVADRVVFTGGVADAELDVAITRARAMLLPSGLEGFGLAPVEGWLYGKPAVVSRGAGVAELVHDDVNGFSFEAGDDAAMADAMLKLALNEALAARMGEEGRLSARACYLDRGADDAWKLIQDVMARETRRPPPIERRW